jgi:hypothetical protein
MKAKIYLTGTAVLEWYIRTMDSDIKMAASYLRRAVTTMQSRINEIRGSESGQRQNESREEGQVTQNLRQNELTIARDLSDKNKDQDGATRESMKLVMQDHELRKSRDQLKNNLDHNITEEEKEIRSLQSQIQKLDELARTLEWWRG